MDGPTRGAILKALDLLYDRRFEQFRAPYSKPMFTEQWGHLDGIEDAIEAIRKME